MDHVAGAPFDAVILAGGAARRMCGLDKPSLTVGDRSMVAQVAEAAKTAERIIVVGPARPELPHTFATQEDPPGGGPVAALRAGIRLVEADQVAVLAADLPFLQSSDLEELRTQLRPGLDGSLLVDDEGRDQYLIGLWEVAALRAALDSLGGTAEGVSMRRLLGGLRYARVAIARVPAPWTDCDTQADVENARRQA